MSVAHASAVAQRVSGRQIFGTQELMEPAPIWALSPFPDGFTCEEILIVSPTVGHTVSSPILVTGLASPSQDTLWTAVLDGGGGKIGVARWQETGTNGQFAGFSATVEFTPPANSQSGRIQVWRESVSDGAIVHLSSVSVTIQGYDLDLLLGQLEAAIVVKDYAALRTTMAEPFLVTIDAAKPKTLSVEEALDLLRRQHLGPGAPRMDFSVDTTAFIRHYTRPEQHHILSAISASGWGAAKDGVAVLLVAAVDGRARWVGSHLFTQPPGQQK